MPNENAYAIVSPKNVYKTKAAAQKAYDDGTFVSKARTSNDTMKDLSDGMDQSNKKDPGPNKIEVIIKKRRH